MNSCSDRICDRRSIVRSNAASPARKARFHAAASTSCPNRGSIVLHIRARAPREARRRESLVARACRARQRTRSGTITSRKRKSRRQRQCPPRSRHDAGGMPDHEMDQTASRTEGNAASGVVDGKPSRRSRHLMTALKDMCQAIRDGKRFTVTRNCAGDAKVSPPPPAGSRDCPEWGGILQANEGRRPARSA